MKDNEYNVQVIVQLPKSQGIYNYHGTKEAIAKIVARHIAYSESVLIKKLPNPTQL